MIETTQERRERFAARLASALDERGFARFPLAGDPSVFEDDERLREARHDLWAALEDLEAAGRPVVVTDLADATVIRWAG